MKTIEVVAAIIVKDGKILATQRGYGEYKDGTKTAGNSPAAKCSKAKPPKKRSCAKLKKNCASRFTPTSS